MSFSRQKYWSGWPCPPPGDLPDPGIRPASPASPASAGRFLTTASPRKPCLSITHWLKPKIWEGMTPPPLFLTSHIKATTTVCKRHQQVSTALSTLFTNPRTQCLSHRPFCPQPQPQETLSNVQTHLWSSFKGLHVVRRGQRFC